MAVGRDSGCGDHAFFYFDALLNNRDDGRVRKMRLLTRQLAISRLFKNNNRRVRANKCAGKILLYKRIR